MEQPGLKRIILATGLLFFFIPLTGAFAEDFVAESSVSVEPLSPKSELDKLKTEWEQVREQQIQMIREKEDQLEKLKEEVLAKMQTLNAAPTAEALPVDTKEAAPVMEPSSGEDPRAAFQAERQKFFKEMARQKESLRQQQAALDEKAKQLEAERRKFESEKTAAAS